MKKPNVRVHMTNLETERDYHQDVFFPSACLRQNPDPTTKDTAWIEFDEFWKWAGQTNGIQYCDCEWIGPTPQEVAQN